MKIRRLAKRVVPLLAVGVLSAGCGGGNAAPGPAPGPGDVAEHFPVTVGSRWFYDTTSSTGSSLGAPPGSASPPVRVRVDVTGTRQVGGVSATVFTATRVGDGTAVEEALFAKDASGVTQFAGASVDPAVAQLYPYRLVTFPLEGGASFEQLSRSGLDYGRDLDGDGRNERIDVRSTVSVAGTEHLELPAGSFDAVRVDTTVVLTLHATSGQTATVHGAESVWYAPGVGRVRSTQTITGGSATTSEEDVLVGYDVEGRRGGFVRDATVASALWVASSDTEMPGRVALSWDGSGHLVVAPTNPTGAWLKDELRAWVVGAGGEVSAPRTVLAGQGWSGRPAAAFNGQSHLVVSIPEDNPGTRLVGQRLTAGGDPLDGATGFVIATGSAAVYPPALASDGSGWLVAWTGYQDGLNAARVSAQGAVLGATMPLRPVAAGPGFPSVAYGGGVYLVAWVEGQQVLATRITPAGAVLDDPPVVISSAPGAKWMGGVAFGGGQFLLTWLDARRGEPVMNGPALDVYAARVAPDGTLLDGPPGTGGIAVNAFPGVSKADPQVAFDGSRFVLTWYIEGFYGDVGVFAARVGADGALRDGPPSGRGRWIAWPTAYASRLVHPVIAAAADGGTLLVWVDNSESSSNPKALRAAWYVW